LVFKKKKMMSENELEIKRKEKDVIYRITGYRKDDETLQCYVNGICDYLKNIFGKRFEKLPQFIGDHERNNKNNNDGLISICERIITENSYKILIMTFFLFLAYMKDMQDMVLKQIPEDSKRHFHGWLTYLQDRSTEILNGVGDTSDAFCINVIMEYVLKTSFFASSNLT